jgi:cytoskeleton protein RodZ
MTDPAINGNTEPSLSPSDITSIGRRLASAREALGLSVADVARQIKLSVHQVQALEADDLARLPKSPVIVKGFLRNYARLVQLDPDQLLGTVHGVAGAGAEPKGRRRQREVVAIERPSRTSFKVALGGLLLVAILLGAYEYYMNPEFFSPPGAPQPVERVAPAPGPSQQATAETSVQPAETTPDASATAEAIPAASAALSEPPAAAVAAAPGVVRFRVDRDAWIEVKDRDGNRIMNQLVKAGTEKSVQGEAPLQLVVGAASGVKVEWNGQPVDIVPFTKVDVARLSLE